jgi:hypothetical protein
MSENNLRRIEQRPPIDDDLVARYIALELAELRPEEHDIVSSSAIREIQIANAKISKQIINNEIPNERKSFRRWAITAGTSGGIFLCAGLAFSTHVAHETRALNNDKSLLSQDEIALKQRRIHNDDTANRRWALTAAVAEIGIAAITYTRWNDLKNSRRQLRSASRLVTALESDSHWDETSRLIWFDAQDALAAAGNSTDRGDALRLVARDCGVTALNALGARPRFAGEQFMVWQVGAAAYVAREKLLRESIGQPLAPDKQLLSDIFLTRVLLAKDYLGIDFEKGLEQDARWNQIASLVQLGRSSMNPSTPGISIA